MYCSISGFGSSGPYSDRPSYDSVAQALSGFLSVVVDNRRPQFLGPALADAITGMYASQAILAALVQRGRSGRGSHVEISMLEAMAHFAIEPFAAFFALGETPTSADRPRLAQAYILRTSDGRLIAIHLSSLEKFWQGLVAALEAPELPNTKPCGLSSTDASRASRLNIGCAACKRKMFLTRPSISSMMWCVIRRLSIWGSWCRSSRRTPPRAPCARPRNSTGRARFR